jgi:hypothetical protein
MSDDGDEITGTAEVAILLAAKVASLTAERDRLRVEAYQMRNETTAARAGRDRLRHERDVANKLVRALEGMRLECLAERDEALASLAKERERNSWLTAELANERIQWRTQAALRLTKMTTDRNWCRDELSKMLYEAALRDAVVEALRPLVAASKQSTAPRTPMYQAVIDAFDALDAGAAAPEANDA